MTTTYVRRGWHVEASVLGWSLGALYFKGNSVLHIVPWSRMPRIFVDISDIKHTVTLPFMQIVGRAHYWMETI